MQADVPEKNACIICDVQMPGISGLELPGLLARAGRDMPIIFVTAHDTEESRAIAQRAHAAAYVRKPVDDQALLDAIDRAMNDKTTE